MTQGIKDKVSVITSASASVVLGAWEHDIHQRAPDPLPAIHTAHIEMPQDAPPVRS